MKRNVGKIDRLIRVAIGTAILILGAVTGSWWGLIGLIPLGTALMQWCPLYAPFHISTCGADDVHGVQHS